jgi:light-regulated signal transduction histidine kinase (bacteriophytochrome)
VVRPVIEKSNAVFLLEFENEFVFQQLEYNERIFEMFQRLHSEDEYTGTGIGLAICKRIVENHHGIITASGTLNEGARFDIYIPVKSNF